VTHTSHFPVVRARADALPQVSRHGLLTMFLNLLLAALYILWNARLGIDAPVNAKGSKFYAMAAIFETRHAQQDGVW
jgi:hypothetical protein